MGSICSSYISGISIHALAKRATSLYRFLPLKTVFQSTPSRRGRQSLPLFFTSTFVIFQSTPSRRGRRATTTPPTSIVIFQSTPSRRGRQPLKKIITERIISIHALAKRATFSEPSLHQAYAHFNPRPREEGDAINTALLHAKSLFQSTPSRRGRPSIVIPPYHICIFQSTPSRRGRRSYFLVSFRVRPISIHALAKRATCTVIPITDRPVISIHALAKRATKIQLSATVESAFQSTPSRRGRPAPYCNCLSISSHFNPRPREEGDFLSALINRIAEVFQSTPSRRGRLVAPITYFIKHCISIHALAKRATIPRNTSSIMVCDFNPRPREEGDQMLSRPYSNDAISIHALAKRATKGFCLTFSNSS